MSRIKCFSRFEYHMFYVLYQSVTYLLTLPRMKLQSLLFIISMNDRVRKSV
jgi:hypothetical protein